MRKDAIGMFWQDVPKVEIKRQPPERYWEVEGYIPDDYDNIMFFEGFRNYLTDKELIELAYGTKKNLFFDIETYPNYYCVNFTYRADNGAKFFMSFEHKNNVAPDLHKLKWIFENFTVVGFNSNSFDLPITTLILNGKTPSQVKLAADLIIVQEMRKQDLFKRFDVAEIAFDSIDLIEVAPLKASLKIYGGRLHTPQMWDLPYPPSTVLTNEQALLVREYCFNDNEQTMLLFDCLKEQIKLRHEMSAEYGVDLRSKSDAQIAETVITSEIRKLKKGRLSKPRVEPGRVYQYQPPHFLRFKSPLMQGVFKTILDTPFVVADHGGILMPESISSLDITINETKYQMGIGGLHSCEKSARHIAGNGIRLIDRDVASYYPMIILLCRLYPEHLGYEFLEVYKSIVDRRLIAKRNGDKTTADSLKIVVNGSFGKLGSQYSMLYAPNLMIQVTITGQLSLLMLIERLELAGVQVVSANTDGVVIKATTEQDVVVADIIKQWELDTGFETEETEYEALYSRDINNYVAVKKGGGFKGKGAFADPWSDKKNPAMVLHKNPSNQVCINACVHHITTGGDIETFIRDCKDITQFVSVRTVKGGAYKDGVGFLGKSIRWYYATGESEPIIYAASGNKVPKTEGAKPLMYTIGMDGIPDDLDYGWYVRETESMLVDLGFTLSD